MSNTYTVTQNGGNAGGRRGEGLLSHHVRHLSAKTPAERLEPRARAKGWLVRHPPGFVSHPVPLQAEEQRSKEEEERGGEMRAGAACLFPLRRWAARTVSSLSSQSLVHSSALYMLLSETELLVFVTSGGFICSRGWKGRGHKDEDSWTMEKGWHRRQRRARAGAGAQAGRTALPGCQDWL